MATDCSFQPDWVSPPGETITEILAAKRMPLNEFAQQMHYTCEAAEELITGHVQITKQVAEKLATVLGASSTFWSSRYFQYRDDVARLRRSVPTEEGQAWLAKLPINDMRKFGWIPPASNSVEQIDSCLEFFDVHNISAWQKTYAPVLKKVAFKTSRTFDSNPSAVISWLRKGEIEGRTIICKAWDADRFRKLLPNLRSLTREKDPSVFVPELQTRCAEHGVAAVIVRAPAGCRASGATRFLSGTKALLLLSFRHLSDDHFWFSFFHEAGHLLLHGRERLFLEGTTKIDSKEEIEANEFSARILIPMEYASHLETLSLDNRTIIRFSRRIGISPGIVVGQLQHAGRIQQNRFNRLKRRFRWGD